MVAVPFNSNEEGDRAGDTPGQYICSLEFFEANERSSISYIQIFGDIFAPPPPPLFPNFLDLDLEVERKK